MKKLATLISVSVFLLAANAFCWTQTSDVTVKQIVGYEGGLTIIQFWGSQYYYGYVETNDKNLLASCLSAKADGSTMNVILYDTADKLNTIYDGNNAYKIHRLILK